MSSSVGDVQLKVKTQDLQARAVSITTNVTAIKNEFRNIEQIINKTSGYWQGSGGDRYRAVYNTYKDNIDEIVKRFGEYAVDLNKIAQVYEQTEQQIESIASDLPDDVIV